MGFCPGSVLPKVYCISGFNDTYTQAQQAIMYKGVLAEHDCVAEGVTHACKGFAGRGGTKGGKGKGWARARGLGPVFPAPSSASPGF